MIWFRARIGNVVNISKLNSFLNSSTARQSLGCTSLKAYESKLSQLSLWTTSIRGQSDQSMNRRKLEFARNYVVYEIKNNYFLLKLLTAGYVAFAFSLYFTSVVQGLRTLDMVVKEEEFVSQSKTNWILYKVSEFVHLYSKQIAFASLCFGGAIVFLCQFYCISSIRSITLLKGGENVIIELFRANPFSSNYKQLNVPLKDICFHGSRKDKHSTIQVTIFKHRGHYIIDKNAHYDDFLFDKVVGLFRDIKNKKI